ncbi:uncharacterized protein LOC131655883 [Vicia villosa]|uniref:uncharacterized protein LOC131655882 n=1 Tax=Vicia villosa TaxID=3911 RepID=UPI00273B444B|nr:uncharacterized protein LOC131655882 [Vicia villosa]XP_058781666.1 uncharacterized protein LOC131655883 [Vicia villosa]
MSMEFETRVTIPHSESFEEREKGLESEEESEEELSDWELKRPEDLVPSDFSMYDDDPKPFHIYTRSFVYKNEAQVEKEKQIKIAMADYRERSRNLSRFDAIAPPKIAELCGSIIPLPIDDDLRLVLTPLCNVALEKYNDDNQDANFVLTDIVKTTWSPGGMYYITFQAQDPSNTHATTFQAQVHQMCRGPPKVISCAIKT